LQCGPCKFIGPKVEQLAKHYGEEKVVLIKVDIDELEVRTGPAEGYLLRWYVADVHACRNWVRASRSTRFRSSTFTRTESSSSSRFVIRRSVRQIDRTHRINFNHQVGANESKLNTAFESLLS